MSVQLKGGKDPNSPWREWKVVGIIGSRRRDTDADLRLVNRTLDEVIKQYELDQFILCSGGCPKGGDRFAEIIAKRHGLSILIHYPNWPKFGKSAGFVRNNNIAHDSDILIACVTEDRKGGTEDTIGKFGDKGPLILV